MAQTKQKYTGEGILWKAVQLSHADTLQSLRIVSPDEILV